MKNETVIVKGLKKKTDYKKNWNYTHLLAKWHANLFYPALKKKKNPKKKNQVLVSHLAFPHYAEGTNTNSKGNKSKICHTCKVSNKKVNPTEVIFFENYYYYFFFFKGIHGIWAPSSGTINILKTSHLFICLIVWPTPQNNLTL